MRRVIIYIVIFLIFLFTRHFYGEDLNEQLNNMANWFSQTFFGKETIEEVFYAPKYTSKPTVTSTPSTIERVKELLAEYHQSHTYSYPDLFVCVDMAIEFWNILKTKGINAKISVGRIDRSDADWTEYDHAWVLAETRPFRYIACEVTGGYIVYYSSNPNYYKYPTFDNPKEVKEFVRLRQEYFEHLDELQDLLDRYNATLEEYEDLRNEYNYMIDYYNTHYAGRPVTYQSILYKQKIEEKAIELSNLAGELNILEEEIIKEYNILTSIESKIEGLLT